MIIFNGKEPISQDHLARNANRSVIVFVIVQRKKQIQENGMNQGQSQKHGGPLLNSHSCFSSCVA